MSTMQTVLFDVAIPGPSLAGPSARPSTSARPGREVLQVRPQAPEQGEQVAAPAAPPSEAAPRPKQSIEAPAAPAKPARAAHKQPGQPATEPTSAPAETAPPQTPFAELMRRLAAEAGSIEGADQMVFLSAEAEAPADGLTATAAATLTANVAAGATPVAPSPLAEVAGEALPDSAGSQTPGGQAMASTLPAAAASSTVLPGPVDLAAGLTGASTGTEEQPSALAGEAPAPGGTPSPDSAAAPTGPPILLSMAASEPSEAGPRGGALDAFEEPPAADASPEPGRPPAPVEPLPFAQASANEGAKVPDLTHLAAGAETDPRQPAAQPATEAAPSAKPGATAPGAAVSFLSAYSTDDTTQTAEAAASAPAAARPAAQAPVANQVADALAGAASRDGQQVVVRLNPPELGHVRVTIQADGDGVRGLVEVDNPRTLAQLERESTQLVGRLADSGVECRRIEIVLHEPPQRDPADGSGLPWGQQPGWAQREGTADGGQPAAGGPMADIGEEDLVGAASGPAAASYVTEHSINVWM